MEPQIISSTTEAVGGSTTTVTTLLLDTVTATASSTSITLASTSPDDNLLTALLVELFRTVLNLLYWIVTFVTITLPSWLFELGSKSWTLTLNLTTV